MIAGDKALGWALEHQQVAVFWNNQPAPGENFEIASTQHDVSMQYFVAPYMHERDLKKQVDLDAANELYAQLIEHEKPVTALMPPQYIRDYPSITRQLLRANPNTIYRPGIARYDTVIGSVGRVMLSEGIESDLRSFTLTEDLKTNSGKDVMLYRRIQVHPEPAIALYYAENQRGPEFNQSHKGPVHSSTMLKAARENLGQFDINRSFTQGLDVYES